MPTEFSAKSPYKLGYKEPSQQARSQPKGDRHNWHFHDNGFFLTVLSINLSIEQVDQKNSHGFINERAALELSVCQLEV
ncbi:MULTISPECIES: hypothetical protein [unclassified Microcoleus]|uniref:hypothetical protein n=1 Tax=unclassified Microcoleus TaxID=2642155 RepID=UPI002FD039F2